MNCPKILITGPPGCGKTTLIKRIAESIPYPYRGFFTGEIREKGSRVGFEIESFEGDRAVLSHIDIESGYRVSKYGVDIESFERIALPEIKNAISGNSLLIMDEIGKMELFSRDFRELVLEAFESEIPIVATILYKQHPYCDKLRNMGNVEIFQLKRGNIDSIYYEILKVIDYR